MPTTFELYMPKNCRLYDRQISVGIVPNRLADDIVSDVKYAKFPIYGEMVPCKVACVVTEILTTFELEQVTPLQVLQIVLSDAHDQPVGGTVNPCVILHIEILCTIVNIVILELIRKTYLYIPEV